ncbi:MAG: hypothetical protein Q8R50_11580, partial [Sediminibacterium sp.]|nr:hypothetical protein [Sediminibacterium sp.]
MQKRSFLKGLALAGLSTPLLGSSMDKWIDKVSGLSPYKVAADEDFWAGIRGEYLLKPDYINLESGYYNILPKEILENYIGHIREVNYQGAYYMRTVQYDNKKKAAATLAGLVGCTADEVIITRNTTESLDMIIGGFHWNEGDEAVMA